MFWDPKIHRCTIDHSKHQIICKSIKSQRQWRVRLLECQSWNQKFPSMELIIVCPCNDSGLHRNIFIRFPMYTRNQYRTDRRWLTVKDSFVGWNYQNYGFEGPWVCKIFDRRDRHQIHMEVLGYIFYKDLKQNIYSSPIHYRPSIQDHETLLQFLHLRPLVQKRIIPKVHRKKFCKKNFQIIQKTLCTDLWKFILMYLY